MLKLTYCNKLSRFGSLGFCHRRKRQRLSADNIPALSGCQGSSWHVLKVIDSLNDLEFQYLLREPCNSRWLIILFCESLVVNHVTQGRTRRGRVGSVHVTRNFTRWSDRTPILYRRRCGSIIKAASCW